MSGMGTAVCPQMGGETLSGCLTEPLATWATISLFLCTEFRT